MTKEALRFSKSTTKAAAKTATSDNKVYFTSDSHDIYVNGNRYGGDAIYYVTGNTSDAVGVWTGTDSRITEYFEGLTIVFKPVVAGGSIITTLNINNLGPKTCYFHNSTKLTTHYAGGTPILFVYIGGAWKHSDYNTDTKVRTYHDETGSYPILGTRQTTKPSATYADADAEVSYDKAITITPSTGAINASAFYETSDARKKDVKKEIDLDRCYDLIEKCSTVIYSWKDDEEHRDQVGMIAQEVREFFPEIVNENQDGFLSLDYAKLTVICIRVLKDLIDKVNKLK